MVQQGQPDSTADVRNQPPVCHSCGEESAADSSFCEHCGADLRSNQQTKRKRSKGKQLGRRRANKEIASIVNLLKGVRGLYIMLACIYGVVFMLLIVAASTTNMEGEDDPAIFWVLVTSGAVFLFSLFGAAFLNRNPLAWSLALSGLISLDVAYSILSGHLPVLGGLLALICWSATIKIASIRGLLSEFSDTVAAQRFLGTRKMVEGGELSTRAKLRAAQVRSKHTPKVAAFVIGGILAMGLLIVLATKSRKQGDGAQAFTFSDKDRASLAKAQLRRERSYETAIEDFIRAWKRSDLRSIAAHIPEGGERTLAMNRFQRSLERYGLTSNKLPPIDDRRDLWSRRSPEVKTYFRLPEIAGELRAKLRTNWVEIESKWTLVAVSLRKTKRD